MEYFIKEGGLLLMVQKILAQMDTWKSKDLARKWRTYLQDLLAFSKLKEFMKGFQDIKLIFELMTDFQTVDYEKLNQPTPTNQYMFEEISNIPKKKSSNNEKGEEQDKRYYESLEKNSIVHMYQNLLRAIKLEKDIPEREVMEKILDKLAIVCKEKKRRRVD